MLQVGVVPDGLQLRPARHQLPPDGLDLGLQGFLLDDHLLSAALQFLGLALRRSDAVESGKAERVEPASHGPDPSRLKTGPAGASSPSKGSWMETPHSPLYVECPLPDSSSSRTGDHTRSCPDRC